MPDPTAPPMPTAQTRERHLKEHGVVAYSVDLTRGALLGEDGRTIPVVTWQTWGPIVGGRSGELASVVIPADTIPQLAARLLDAAGIDWRTHDVATEVDAWLRTQGGQ